MSEMSTPATAEHFRYLAERTIQEDPFLKELKDAARAVGIPPIWISPEQGAFMQILLKLCVAREVIEIGTLAGYSAIWMARALPTGGHIRTIEKSGARADFAERWVAKSDMAVRIKIYRGEARDILPGFSRDSADAAFIDADKTSNPLYLEECLRIVRCGGLIMVDNAFAFGRILEEPSGDADLLAVRSFNDAMTKHNGLKGIILPIGDGLWVAVKC